MLHVFRDSPLVLHLPTSWRPAWLPSRWSVTRSPKQGHQLPHKKGLTSSKFFKKRKKKDLSWCLCDHLCQYGVHKSLGLITIHHTLHEVIFLNTIQLNGTTTTSREVNGLAMTDCSKENKQILFYFTVLHTITNMWWTRVQGSLRKMLYRSAQVLLQISKSSFLQ